jgi:crossover junction endodeoxyribonuclease RuvC
MRYVGIDPSTKTGFVALDENGEVVKAKELIGIGDKDPKRITTLVQEVTSHVKKGDQIGIEGFSYNSKGRGIGFQFGVGYAFRIALYSRNHSYREITPGQLKKFATGNGNAAKENMVQPILETWGYTHNSDNVLDAFILAKIMYSIENRESLTFSLTDYQQDVIESILNPQSKPKKKGKKPRKAVKQ